MKKRKFLFLFCSIVMLVASSAIFADDSVEPLHVEEVVESVDTDSPSDLDENSEESQFDEADAHILNTIFTQELEENKIDELFEITEKQVEKFEKLFSASLEISEFSARIKDNKYTYVFFVLNGKEVDVIYQGNVRNYKIELVQTLESIVKDVVIQDENENDCKILSKYNVFLAATGGLDIGDIALVPCLGGGLSSYVVTQKRESGDQKFSLLTPLYEKKRPIEGVIFTKKKKPLSLDITFNSSFIDSLSFGADAAVKYPIMYPVSLLAGIRACYSLDSYSPLSTNFGALVGAECQISAAKLFERRLPLSIYTRFDLSTCYQTSDSKISFTSDFELGLRWYLSPLFSTNFGIRLYTIPQSSTNSNIIQVTLGISKIL